MGNILNKFEYQECERLYYHEERALDIVYKDKDPKSEHKYENKTIE